MTAADTRVGDADISGTSEGGVTTPLSYTGIPFLGRSVDIRSGIARGRRVGTVLGGFRSPEGQIWGFPGRREFLHGKSCRRGRTWWRGRDCRTEELAGAEELGGAEEIAGTEDIAGAVAIAPLGFNI